MLLVENFKIAISFVPKAIGQSKTVKFMSASIMRKQFYSIGPSAFPIRGSDGGSSDTMQEAQQQKRAEREREREREGGGSLHSTIYLPFNI